MVASMCSAPSPRQSWESTSHRRARAALGGDLRGPRRLAPTARATGGRTPRSPARRRRSVSPRSARVGFRVAEVLVAVQLDLVAAARMRRHELRVGAPRATPDKENISPRLRVPIRNTSITAGVHTGSGPSSKVERDGPCEGGSHSSGTSRSPERSSAGSQPFDRVAGTHVRHERRGALAPHGMQGILGSTTAPRPSRMVRRWHRRASNRWRSRALRR